MAYASLPIAVDGDHTGREVGEDVSRVEPQLAQLGGDRAERLPCSPQPIAQQPRDERDGREEGDAQADEEVERLLIAPYQVREVQDADQSADQHATGEWKEQRPRH